MKGLMITGPASNSGKTTLTLGLIRALKNRGLAIAPFKTGPDFIDRKYMEMAAGAEAGNLDIHLMGGDGLRSSLSMGQGDLAIVEGAMGYFDGIYNSFENSSYDMGRKLDIPAVLVYSPKGEMFSAIPKIKGMVDFARPYIKGLILNKVSPTIYGLLKEQIERHIDIEVLGYLPQDQGLAIETASLGLDLSKGEDYLEYTAKMVEKTIDLDKFLGLAQELDLKDRSLRKAKEQDLSGLDLREGQCWKKRDIKVALAYDEAFNFYYRENIRLLENTCQLEYFSPLWDKKVPEADLIYIGGGYPENYRKELAGNKEILKDIRKKGEEGQYILGESAGLLYLSDGIEGYEMVGLLKGHGRVIQGLKRFGYVNMEIQEDCILGKKGHSLKGQEYHKTMLVDQGNEIFNISKPMSKRGWQCGYSYKNTLGYFQHVNFLGNMKAFDHLLEKLENNKRGKRNVY